MLDNRQDKAQDIQLTVLPDRSQGGSSLYDGTLELMVRMHKFYTRTSVCARSHSHVI